MNTIGHKQLRVLPQVGNRIIVHQRVLNHALVNVLFNIKTLKPHFSMVIALITERDIG